jgi:hypothetical protein
MAKDTPGSTPPLSPDDNPAVGTVTPDDYPEGRKGANLDAGRDEDLEFERKNPGSGPDARPE